MLHVSANIQICKTICFSFFLLIITICFAMVLTQFDFLSTCCKILLLSTKSSLGKNILYQKKIFFCIDRKTNCNLKTNLFKRIKLFGIKLFNRNIFILEVTVRYAGQLAPHKKEPIYAKFCVKVNFLGLVIKKKNSI